MDKFYNFAKRNSIKKFNIIYLEIDIKQGLWNKKIQQFCQSP